MERSPFIFRHTSWCHRTPTVTLSHLVFIFPGCLKKKKALLRVISKEQQQNRILGAHTYTQCVLCRSGVSNSWQSHGLQPTRLLCLQDFSSKNTGVGCHFLLQGICPTEVLNPGLLHCRQILYRLNHQVTLVHSNKHVINSSSCYDQGNWKILL